MGDRKEELIEAMEEALDIEFGIVTKLLAYHATLKGAMATVYRPWLKDEAMEEMKHVIFLSSRISDLGGYIWLAGEEHPGRERSTENGNLLPIPGYDPTDINSMLLDLAAAERDAIAVYKSLVSEAMEAGEWGLSLSFEDMLEEETNHLFEINRLLGL
jgi:bacterioferritin